MSELILCTTEDGHSQIAALYIDDDKHRKQDEARQADAQNDVELHTLDNTLKKQPKP
ncbi:hypothetical protein [Pseudomonas sp. D3-10]|uniref:hypothetical protein n=1 Tax=Pseudomonas sp. D3-10 TaxID=2817392 RepID=UPI003DA906DC